MRWLQWIIAATRAFVEGGYACCVTMAPASATSMKCWESMRAFLYNEQLPPYTEQTLSLLMEAVTQTGDDYTANADWQREVRACAERRKAAERKKKEENE